MSKKPPAGAAVFCLSLTSAAPVSGGHDDGPRYHDTARVVDVEPIYRTMHITRPREECWTEEVAYRRPTGDPALAALAGGVIGAIVGHQVGGGSGRKVATAAGALIGASVGHGLSHRHGEMAIGLDEHCHLTEEHHVEQRLQGYQVTYRYRGQTHVTHMAHHPGDYLELEVDVRPRHSRW